MPVGSQIADSHTAYSCVSVLCCLTPIIVHIPEELVIAPVQQKVTVEQAAHGRSNESTMLKGVSGSCLQLRTTWKPNPGPSQCVATAQVPASEGGAN